MILITSYTNPDLDGVACAVAMAEFLQQRGREARAGVFGAPGLEAAWFLQQYEIPTPPDGQPLLTPDVTVLLVDASDPMDLSFPADRVIEIMDHRQAHRADAFANAKDIQIELVGSCATLVVERMRAANVVPTRDTARLLSGAIASNTVNFRAPVTTDRDRVAFAWLTPIAALPVTFVQEMFVAKSDLRGDRLQEALVGDYTVKEFGGHRIVIFQLEATGVLNVFRARRAELEESMRRVCAEERCEFMCCNGIDLAAATSHVLVIDIESQHVLERALDITFHHGITSFDHIFGRKMMMPRLKAALEA
ncbi:MAG: DHH family phosphoesterase [bacterium]|nr:DHH family phosphoesterase [bacterium]